MQLTVSSHGWALSVPKQSASETVYSTDPSQLAERLARCKAGEQFAYACISEP